MTRRLKPTCLVLVCFAASYLVSCSTVPSHQAHLEFKKASSPSVKGQFPNWQLPPHELETTIYGRALAGKLHAEEVKRTTQGTTGAFYLVTEDEVTGKELKWKFKKMVPGWLDSFNTSFRKEIAAYEVQKFFLDPEDYVVPTALPICVSRERYLKVIGYAAASLEGTDCVLGLASTWLVNVTVPDRLYDESRFLEDPTYAYYMSNFNILTYLIQHRDARVGQFLVSKDDKRRQVFSIDNGISFGFWPYNFFITHRPAAQDTAPGPEPPGGGSPDGEKRRWHLAACTARRKHESQKWCYLHRWHLAIRSHNIRPGRSLGAHPVPDCRGGRRQHPGFLRGEIGP